jgi:hypothetical protein
MKSTRIDQRQVQYSSVAESRGDFGLSILREPKHLSSDQKPGYQRRPPGSKVAKRTKQVQGAVRFPSHLKRVKFPETSLAERIRQKVLSLEKSD